jgi:hypothetical protein
MKRKKKTREILVVIGILVVILVCWAVFHRHKLDGPGKPLIYQDF